MKADEFHRLRIAKTLAGSLSDAHQMRDRWLSVAFTSRYSSNDSDSCRNNVRRLPSEVFPPLPKYRSETIRTPAQFRGLKPSSQIGFQPQLPRRARQTRVP